MGNFLLEVKMCFIMLKYWGYSTLDNATLHIHVKCPFYKKWNKKKTPIFFSRKIFTLYLGSSKNFLNVPNLQSTPNWNLAQFCYKILLP